MFIFKKKASWFSEQRALKQLSFNFFLFFKHFVLQLWRSSGSSAHTEVRLHWPDLNSAQILEKPPKTSKGSSLQAAFISLRWKMLSAEMTMRPEQLNNMIHTHTRTHKNPRYVPTSASISGEISLANWSFSGSAEDSLMNGSSVSVW